MRRSFWQKVRNLGVLFFYCWSNHFQMAQALVRTSWRPKSRTKKANGTAQIVIGDQYSRVVAEKEETLRALRKQFSFLHPSFWFMRGRFGGSGARSRFATTTNFITEKGRFATGLLESVAGEVRSFLFQEHTKPLLQALYANILHCHSLERWTLR